ncbi:alpha/beta hydrolase [Longirhabdus pacifica]|uniref:alpha/beta hydrolase n=1 Tax=Longirhabdus pacifica TaxID=2305227 RepID=UPI0010089C34|nr:alpha/beta hydrolase-fold protein [Longirhabdus pacifica]
MSFKYSKRKIEKHTISSQFLNDERTLRIYLPQEYDPLQSYPVIYCQDGAEFFNFGRIATHASQLIEEEGLQPMIIVGIDVNLPQRSAEYAPNGNRFIPYCNFVTQEVIPEIEKNYATIQDPAHRIFAGDSLGATVSLHLVLDHPHLSHKCLALSGAFFPSTQQRLEQEEDLSWLDMYMLIGTEETDVKTDYGVFDFLSLNRDTKTILQQKNTSLYYVENKGKHIWGFWQNELPHALSHFF